jgi:hypothetical protein
VAKTAALKPEANGKFPVLADDPDYCAALAKRDDMRDRLLQLRVKETELTNRDSRRDERRQQRAEALLAGKALEGMEVVSTAQRLQELAEQIKDHEAALELADTRLADVSRTVGKRIGEQLLPEHRRRAREVFEKMVALSEANDSETELRDHLLQNEISAGPIKPMAFPYIGSLRDPNSHICIALREAMLVGYLTPTDPLVERVKSMHEKAAENQLAIQAAAERRGQRQREAVPA